MQQRVVVSEPVLSRRLFSEVGPVSGPVWLIIRLFLGASWLEAGWHKVLGEEWTPAVVRSFWERAVAVPAQGRPPIAYEWYRWFLQTLLDIGAERWMAGAIAVGEVLIGTALILGALVGISAFFGAVMNMSFLLAGTASTNPVLLLTAILLMLAWKTAGWWGMDRWLLPALGTPWSPVEVRGASPEPRRT
jgi:thiosulfate dehydrogenase [quinone] large subunit